MTRWLCQIGFFMTLVVVTLGALTRLLDAGLGCPDWPGCYGSFTPPEIDEYTGLAVDQLKAWMEMIHRFFAEGLGLVILLMFFKIEREKNHKNTTEKKNI